MSVAERATPCAYRAIRSVWLVCLPLALLLWGWDAQAQPAPGSLPRTAAGVRSLAAGGGHTYAVLADGTVRCWGLNVDGQLGHGEVGATPTAAQGLGAATAIATGRGHTCAALVDGTVRCWGFNGQGQLGRPAIERGRIFPSPAAVAGLSGATGVAAGWEHTCALLRDGGVMCWGGNRRGQLGDGTTSDSAAPVSVRALADVVGIAAGRFHTCGVLRDGSVHCWGDSEAGQLGHAGLASSPVPVAVGAVSSAVALAAGHAHTCALLRDRTIRCWGSNEVGQLGNGQSTSSAVPVVVTGLEQGDRRRLNSVLGAVG